MKYAPKKEILIPNGVKHEVFGQSHQLSFHYILLRPLVLRLTILGPRIYQSTPRNRGAHI